MEISEPAITAKIDEIVKNGDLDQISVKTIRQLLTDHFGVDLTEYKTFIKTNATKIVTEALEARNADSDADDSKDVKEEEQISDDEDEEEEEEEDEDDEEQPAKQKKPGGFHKEYYLSDGLSRFFGEEKMSRPQIVKSLWDYIKANNLQNEKDRRKILFDDRLQAVFGKKTSNMFDINKLITKHVYTAENSTYFDQDDDDEEHKKPAKATPNKKRKKPAAASSASKKAKSTPKKKSPPKKKKGSGGGGGGGFGGPKVLSPALAAVVGSEPLSRAEIVKGLWTYIRANDLQNPQKRSEILCDDKLKRVMDGNETVTMFSMNKYISAHIVGPPASTAAATATAAKVEATSTATSKAAKVAKKEEVTGVDEGSNGVKEEGGGGGGGGDGADRANGIKSVKPEPNGLDRGVDL